MLGVRWWVGRFAPLFYFRLVWLVCDDGGMAEVWALISAKQCVSVSDCVVFVREKGGAVGGTVIGCRLYFCGTVLWAVITWDGDGVLGVSRPFFYFWFVWLVCDDAGWRVRGCNVINGRFV